MPSQYSNTPHFRFTTLSAATKYILLLFGSILLGTYFIRFFPFFIDDTFIHLRYAAHFLDGYGFSYNIGEPPVLGTSSPLWDVLIMPSVMLNRSTPLPIVKWLSLALGVGFLWLLAICLSKTEKELISPDSSTCWQPISLAILLLMASPSHWAWFFSGMEIPLYNLLYVVVLVFIAFIPFQTIKANLYGMGLAIVCFLLYFARPEGAVATLSALTVLFLTPSDRIGHRRKLIFPFLLTICLLTSGWFLYSQAVFGYTVPTSVSAKGAALPLLSQSPVWPLIRCFYMILSVYGLLITCGICLFVAFMRLQPKSFKKWLFTPLALFNLSYIILTIIIYLIKNGRLMERTAGIFGPALVILAGQLLILLWPVLLERITFFRKKQAGVSLGLGIVISIFGFFSLGFVADNYDNLTDRYTKLKGLAEEINRVSPSNKNPWILLETLGVLSYYTEASVRDIAGLVSPEFTGVSHMLEGDVDLGGSKLAAQRQIIFKQIMHRRPRFIVLKPVQYNTFIGGIFNSSQLSLREISRTSEDATGREPFVVWQVNYVS